MDLTICVNCFYGTNFSKLVRQVYSLFDSRFTPNINLYNIPIPSINMFPNKPIELIFVIDNYDVYNFEKQNNINNIINFITGLQIHNTTIKYFKTESNTGVSVCRNIAINNANGKFICFCDDDDLHINANEILSIIDKYNEYYCINCQISTKLNLNPKYFRTSNISVCSAIFNVEFLRNNNIYFPEGVKTEDIIWRAKLYTILSKLVDKRLIEVEIGFYINCLPSRNSNELIIQNYSGNPRFFNSDSYNNIPTNEMVYEKIGKILSNENEMDLNEFTIFAITTALNSSNGFSLLNKYAKNNIEKFNNENQKLIQYSSVLNNGVMKFSDIIEKEECLRLYCIHSSLDDLKKLSHHISEKYIGNINYSLDIFNLLWTWKKNTLYEISNNQFHDRYLLMKLNEIINDVNFMADSNSFNNFCFRYCCLKYLINGTYTNKLSDIIKTNLRDLKLVYYISLLNLNVSDVYMFLKYNYKISFSNQYHYFIIRSNTFGELRLNLINYFGKKMTKIIDEYLQENTFENMNLFKTTYRGNIMKVILYILSPNTM